MTNKQILLLLLVLPVSGRAQTWIKGQANDALHGTAYDEYKLTGQFLVAPKQPHPAAPTLVVHCKAGEHKRTNGHFEGGWIDTGVKLESRLSPSETRELVIVETRLDDGKPKTEPWSIMPDPTQVSIVGSVIAPAFIINRLFFGKATPHKAGSGEQVKRIIVGVNEHEDGQFQMEFDLPDSTEVAEACGLIQH